MVLLCYSIYIFLYFHIKRNDMGCREKKVSTPWVMGAKYSTNGSCKIHYSICMCILHQHTVIIKKRTRKSKK